MWDGTTSTPTELLYDDNFTNLLWNTEQPIDVSSRASTSFVSSPTSLNISAHIAAHLGPQRALPLDWLVPMTAVYVLILIFGLVGNLITILVIFRFRYMQTITNLYLCNLAITDLISLLLSLPLELYTLWHQYPWQLGETMCRMKTLILEGTANASVLTLVAFTVERFLTICGPSSGTSTSNIPPTVGQRPMLFNYSCSATGGAYTSGATTVKRIATRNIALIWTISLGGAMPLVMLTRINYIKHGNEILYESAWCGLSFSEPDKKWELVILASTVLFFFIPLTVISALYYQIARKLKAATRLNSFSRTEQLRTTPMALGTFSAAVTELPSIVRTNDVNVHHSSTSNSYYGASRKLMQSRKIVIRMLVVIVIVFTFCWSPFHAQRLLFLYVSLYSSWNLVLRQINSVLYLSAGCLYYLNSSLNPLIYSLLSTRFRAAFTLYVNSLCAKYNSASKSASRNSGAHHNHSGMSNGSNSRAQQSQHRNYPPWPASQVPAASALSMGSHQNSFCSLHSNNYNSESCVACWDAQDRAAGGDSAEGSASSFPYSSSNGGGTLQPQSLCSIQQRNKRNCVSTHRSASSLVPTPSKPSFCCHLRELQNKPNSQTPSVASFNSSLTSKSSLRTKNLVLCQIADNNEQNVEQISKGATKRNLQHCVLHDLRTSNTTSSSSSSAQAKQLDTNEPAVS